MPDCRDLEDWMLFTNFYHFSTNATAAIGVVMLPLAGAVNSSVSVSALPILLFLGLY